MDGGSVSFLILYIHDLVKLTAASEVEKSCSAPWSERLRRPSFQVTASHIFILGAGLVVTAMRQLAPFRSQRRAPPPPLAPPRALLLSRLCVGSLVAQLSQLCFARAGPLDVCRVPVMRAGELSDCPSHWSTSLYPHVAAPLTWRRPFLERGDAT